MSYADQVYLDIAENILKYGEKGENRTDTPAIKLPHQIMKFDLSKEFPILTTKQVAFRNAVIEILWIYRDQSNDVTLLQNQNVHIWDEWADQNNTIGKAYGYQIKKFHQIDRLIHTLKHNPQDRAMIMSLWNFEDLEEMNLRPCAFQTIWDVTDGKLNCLLIQRSGDWGLGIPFNFTQYAVLVHLLAQVTGFQPGILTHIISNAHIYENHVDAIATQITRKNEAKEAPTLWINPAIKNFYDFTINDIKLVNYQHLSKLKMKVSV